jgi:hypothetical protein
MPIFLYYIQILNQSDWDICFTYKLLNGCGCSICRNWYSNNLGKIRIQRRKMIPICRNMLIAFDFGAGPKKHKSLDDLAHSSRNI